MKSRSENQKSFLESLRVLLLLVAILLAAASCTKSKELKDETGSALAEATDKSQFAKAGSQSLEGGGEFSLSRGIEDALYQKDNQNAAGAIPGFSTDYGIVRAEITENSLRFIQDQGVNNRADTANVLVAYPIKEHFDVVRETNDYGDQTNKIVKDTKKPWNERKYMVVDWTSPSNPVGKLSFQVGADSTAQETDAVLVEPLKANDKDMNFLTEVSIDNTRVRMRTHFAKVGDSDFKPVIYNRDDFKRFGYFLTEHANINDDGVTKDQDDLHYAEMFNVCEASRQESCATNKIVWRLSKGFPDRYLEKTRQVVREWNQAFKDALGRSDDVVVLEEKQVDMSDPTSNVIAYYEPEAGGGLLGVAQGTVDWRTGEKLSARATVYEAGIRYTLGGIDTLIDLIKEDPSTLESLKNENSQVETKSLVKPKPLNLLEIARNARLPGMKSVNPNQIQDLDSLNAVIQKNIDGIRNSISRTNSLESAAVASAGFSNFVARDTKILSTMLSGDDLRKAEGESFQRIITLGAALRAQRDKAAQMISKASLTSEASGVHNSDVVEEAAIRFIQKLIKDGMTADALDANRAAIKENIAQLTFYTTLLHEMGHTFGLRHNFAGTADEKNFLPEYFQVKAKLASHDPSVKPTDLDPHMYSSIMDYHEDFYSGVAGLGPYDKAAIKYAYNRSLDKNSFALDSQGQPKFMFCTDDDLGETVTCRQFDKGSTVSEITKNAINRLKRGYITSHFRRGRASYLSSYDDYRALESRLFMQYVQVRQAIDELVYQMLTQGHDASGCFNFIKKSVASQELTVDLCDKAQLEKLQSLDVRQLVKLVKPLADGQKYVPNGFADLVVAGNEAMQFFVDTLGAPEPGLYIPDPKGAKEMVQVAGLSGQPSDQQIEAAKQQVLQSWAGKTGLKDPVAIQKFAKDHYAQVLTLKPGTEAKYLYGRSKRDGFGFERDVVPFSIDKQIALAAFSTRDIGVAKYSEEQTNMQGNAYLWFHTADWAHEVVESVINGDAKLKTVTLPAAGGSGSEDYLLPGSIDRDIQVQSMALGLTEYTSFDNTDFLNRTKFYHGNDPAMAGITDLEKVSFTGADGTLYTAFQTPDNKSIALDIAKTASDASDAVNLLGAITQDPAGAKAAAQKKMADAEALRAQAESAFNHNQDLVAAAKQLFSSTDATSLWNRTKTVLAQALDKTVDQNSVQNQNQQLLALAQQSDDQVGKQIAGHLQSDDDKNCWHQIATNGSPAGLGKQCQNAIAVFNVNAAYAKAMNAILDALNFVDATQNTAPRLQKAQGDLQQAQDTASLLTNLQHMLGQ